MCIAVAKSNLPPVMRYRSISATADVLFAYYFKPLILDRTSHYFDVMEAGKNGGDESIFSLSHPEHRLQEKINHFHQ